MPTPIAIAVRGLRGSGLSGALGSPRGLAHAIAIAERYREAAHRGAWLTAFSRAALRPSFFGAREAGRGPRPAPRDAIAIAEHHRGARAWLTTFSRATLRRSFFGAREPGRWRGPRRAGGRAGPRHGVLGHIRAGMPLGDSRRYRPRHRRAGTPGLSPTRAIRVTLSRRQLG